VVQDRADAEHGMTASCSSSSVSDELADHAYGRGVRWWFAD
jgi:hypothetical protein